MARRITQRELRDGSGEIMRGPDRGETFTVTTFVRQAGRDPERIDPTDLPLELAISAVTLAGLATGPHATADADERARRQDRLQRTEATFEALPFDRAAARAYGHVHAAVAGAGRKARGRRAFDLLIAAIAVAGGMPLYTRNPDDFDGLADLLEVVRIPTR